MPSSSSPSSSSLDTSSSASTSHKESLTVTSTRRSAKTHNTERKLDAIAGVVRGHQADTYDVDDMVFVKHNGYPWPARIEDPSNVKDIITRYQYAVFLYGIHERKAAKLGEIFLYEENKNAFGTKSDFAVLNMALVESRLNPDVNRQRVASHKKKRIQYLTKSRSHTLLDRYLAGAENADMNATVESRDGDVVTLIDRNSAGDASSYYTSFISYDRVLGYFAIVSSFLFMAYITWWIIIMPFLEPGYFTIIANYFPHPSQSFTYPVIGGAILACSIIGYVQTQLDR